MKFSKKKCRAAVDAYFRAISYDAPVMDKLGKVLVNPDGDEIHVTRYAVPPSRIGLCLFLGIDRDDLLRPEYSDIVRDVDMRIEGYLEQELLSRDKSVQGVIFSLQSNFGWDKQSDGIPVCRVVPEAVPLSQREQLLREIAADYADR